MHIFLSTFIYKLSGHLKKNFKLQSNLFNYEISNMNTAEIINNAIRKIPDYPQKGILFYDITTVLNEPQAFHLAIDLIADYAKSHNIEAVAGLEARGFITAAAVAYRLNLGFVPIRKKGKLPCAVFCEDYALEYGNATVEIHQDALDGSQTVLLCDDLVATGGTMLAGAELLRRAGANTIHTATVIEFSDMDGGNKIRQAGLPLFSILQVNGSMQ